MRSIDGEVVRRIAFPAAVKRNGNAACSTTSQSRLRLDSSPCRGATGEAMTERFSLRVRKALDRRFLLLYNRSIISNKYSSFYE